MLLTVRGVKQSSGEYNGNPYNNMVIHCIGLSDGSMLCGDPVEIVKVKAPIFMQTLSNIGLEPADLIGCQIRLYYNKYGNVDGFDVCELPDKQ